jgi:hypothetical protein
MNGLPTRDLEIKAAENRKHLHQSVEELRLHLRERLDVTKNTRENLGLACSMAALVSFSLGYAFTGIFVD